MVAVMNILQMSVSAAILILAIVVIRALAIHRLPKKTFVALWGVALFRLLIPLYVPLPFGAYTIADMAMGYFTDAPDMQVVVTRVPGITSTPSQNTDGVWSAITPIASESAAN
jgi:hypothetical protein